MPDVNVRNHIDLPLDLASGLKSMEDTCVKVHAHAHTNASQCMGINKVHEEMSLRGSFMTIERRSTWEQTN